MDAFYLLMLLKRSESSVVLGVRKRTALLSPDPLRDFEKIPE